MFRNKSNKLGEYRAIPRVWQTRNFEILSKLLYKKKPLFGGFIEPKMPIPYWAGFQKNIWVDVDQAKTKARMRMFAILKEPY